MQQCVGGSAAALCLPPTPAGARDPGDPAPAPGARTPLPAGGTPGAPRLPGSMDACPTGLGLRDWGPRPPPRSRTIYSFAVAAAKAERQASQLHPGFLSRR